MNWDESAPIRFKENNVDENTQPEKAEVTRGVVAARVLTTIASLSLGVMAGLAIVGIMTTPAGWAIAGAALCIGLVGAYHYGGVEQLIIAAQLGVFSFAGGLLPGVGFGNGMYICASFAFILTAAILKRCIEEM